MSTQKLSDTSAGRFEKSFAETEEDRAELDESMLAPVNLDVQRAALIVMGAIPWLESQRDAIARDLPAFDIAQFGKLGMYAEALVYAQARYLAASGMVQPLSLIVEHGIRVRRQLRVDVEALINRGLVGKESLAGLKGGRGYLNVASDLGVLVRVLRERWADIEGKTAIEQSELDEAQQIFEEITTAYGRQGKPPLEVARAANERDRAFTLMLRAYGEARRAVSYVRREEGDSEKLAPSLWAGRGGRKASTGSPSRGAGRAAKVSSPSASDVEGLSLIAAMLGATRSPGSSPSGANEQRAPALCNFELGTTAPRHRSALGLGERAASAPQRGIRPAKRLRYPCGSRNETYPRLLVERPRKELTWLAPIPTRLR